MEVLGMRRFLHFSSLQFAILFALLLAQSPRSRAASLDPHVEYKIKAAYLYNFTKFIEWPPAAFVSDQSPYLIGIVERDSVVSQTVKDVLAGKTTSSGRPIQVRTATHPDALDDCQMIFISRTARNDGASAQRSAKKQGVLLVGESDGFAQTGGMINFVVQGGAVRLEINPQRADRAGLRLSGTLASVASLVRDREARRD